MLIIKNLIDNIIDLTDLDEYSNDFEVISLSDNEIKQPYYIEFVSNEGIFITKFDVSQIKIEIDVGSILNDEYFILKNNIGERITVFIKPNNNYVRDKKYKFKITKQEFKEDNLLTLKILSKANDKEIGWKCIYDGKPISYIITPMENDKSSYVTIKLTSKILAQYIAPIVFQQDESEETIIYKIKNTSNGMEKAD